ncbi:hypothetical protein M404DRAFT_484545 [Pisolithus tinctorius Marx 270]|uniref:Uncharacterized protein n=1 Tax=Pisolithus tinctorius Marx 270 TaxID=870435 RepID=A0A0C3P043_PISTI|nr:hypothetical protein M404DRAFT_484545 [Pisolithus tinctorius Marx 270]
MSPRVFLVKMAVSTLFKRRLLSRTTLFLDSGGGMAVKDEQVNNQYYQQPPANMVSSTNCSKTYATSNAVRDPYLDYRYGYSIPPYPTLFLLCWREQYFTGHLRVYIHLTLHETNCERCRHRCCRRQPQAAGLFHRR